MERTFTMIKPDAVERDLVGEILSRIESDGLSIVCLEKTRISDAQARRFYGEHRSKPFFDELIEYITSGSVVLGVVEGEDAVRRLRTIMGATDPEDAAPGTIRAEFASSITENSIHGADSAESAEREIGFFFSESDLIDG